MGVTGCTNSENSKLGASIYFSFHKSKCLLEDLRQNIKKCAIPFSTETASPSEKKKECINYKWRSSRAALTVILRAHFN